MNFKPLLIVHGEPNSVFLEIFFKSLRYKKFKSPLILICSQKILRFQMTKLKFKMKIKILDPSSLNKIKLNNKSINIIDVNYNKNLNFQKISDKSNDYIKNCFETSFNILKSGVTNKFINGPISKSSFLNKKYLGITEYLAKKTKTSKIAMLIYNNNGSAPAFFVENVFVLPGIPSYVETMIPQLKKVLISGKKIISESCDAKVRESSIAVDLEKIQNKYHGIDIGSYPYSNEQGFGTTIVMRSINHEEIIECKKEIESMIKKYLITNDLHNNSNIK